MNQLKITCPSCNQVFSADDALQNHLKAKEAKIQEEMKTKEKMLDAKYKLELQLKEKTLEKNLSQKLEKANKDKLNLLQTKINDAEKTKKDLMSKYSDNLKKKDKDLEKRLLNEKELLTQEIKEENKLKLKTLEAKIQNAEKTKAELEAKHNSALKKKEVFLENKLKEQEKLLEKKLKTESQSELVKLSKQLLEKDKQLLSQAKETEIFKKRAQKRLDEVEKQLKQKSVEVQGEVQEELLQDFLRNKFPQDDVIEIKKGAKGGDCILSINDKDKQNLAQIYFESKDHKSFKEEWISKLLKDMKDKSIDAGILVTKALPKDTCKFEGHLERHGKRIMIVPMEYRLIYTLVSSIRANLIEKFKSKKDFDAPKEMKRLWDHITGPSFQLPVRNLYQTMQSMNKYIEKEKIFLDKNIANKERTMQDMDEEFKDMINSFVHKVGNEVLPETLLQITNNKEKK